MYKKYVILKKIDEIPTCARAANSFEKVLSGKYFGNFSKFSPNDLCSILDIFDIICYNK